ncbi:MAG: penicillin acylase family protein, partial [Ferruginibacter sp.]
KKTEWLATHNIEDLVYVYNPPGGWLQNCNSTPFTAAGPYSPRRGDYLPYMAPDAENFRGLNAVRILSMKKKYSMQDLIDVGYDRHLVAFDSLLPSLHNAYYSDENLRQEQAVNEAMGLLDSWDRNVDINSVALTVAIHLGEKLLPFIAAVPKTPVEGFVEQMHTYLQRTDAKILINALHETLLELNARYGTWKIPWGDINRFQRLDNNRVASFNDSLSSYAVPYVSSTWGMLPAFASRRYAGTAKRYGWGGNSFICVVDFGPRVKAKSLLAGGESGDPASPHFFDQAGLYATGKFRDVFFYKEDVKANANITYHPGDK